MSEPIEHIHGVGCYYRDAAGIEHRVCGGKDRHTMTPSTVEWTTEWPTEPGAYWFYGHRSRLRDEYTSPQMSLAAAMSGRSGRVTVALHGHFVMPGELGPHRWAKATLPEPPKLEG